MQLISTIIFLVLIYYIIKNRSNFIAFVARYRYGSGKTQQAIRMLKFADKFGKMKFANRLSYAYLTLKEGDIDEANKLFNLIAMDRLDAAQKTKLKEAHALVFWKRGEVGEAIEMLEYVHKNYTNTNNYGSLGYMYAYSGNLQKALEYNLEAYDYNNTNAIIVDNLAYTYLKLGDYENAEKYYKELFELNPTFPEGYFRYGQHLVENGKKEEGIKLIKKSLDCKFSFLCMFSRRDVLDYLEEHGEDITKLV